MWCILSINIILWALVGDSEGFDLLPVFKSPETPVIFGGFSTIYYTLSSFLVCKTGIKRYLGDVRSFKFKADEIA